MEINYLTLAGKGFPAPTQRVYLLHGSDDALKREALHRLTEPLVDPSFRDFDYEEHALLPGGEENAATGILASAGGVPMASERRVVVVQDVQRLEKKEQEDLAAGLEKLGPLSYLVLVAAPPVYDAGKIKKGTAVETKLLQAAAKAGATVLCDAPDAAALRARAEMLAKERGKTIQPQALKLAVERAHAIAADRGGDKNAGDVTAFLNELEKMLAHAGERKTVTEEDARAVGLRDPQENIFALCDAIGRRDPARALAEAENLLAADPKADAVAARAFVMIARHLRMIWGAKFLAEKRITAQNARALPPDVQALLSPEMIGLTQRQSYRLRDLQEQARRWSEAELADALARVLASDLAMKGTKPPDVLSSASPTLSDDPSGNLRLLSVSLGAKKA